MAATVTIRVHDGGNWNTLPEAQVGPVRLRRRVGAGEASFQLNDASIAQRDLLRTGRECEIVLTVGGETQTFGGFLDRPRLRAESPGHFNIRPRVVDLSHGAAWHNVIDLFSEAGTKYTDTLKGFWGVNWSTVDTSGVADDPATHPEQYRPGYTNLAHLTSEIVGRYLKDWVWYVAHNGADGNGILKQLYVQPRGSNDLTGSVIIGEGDLSLPFEVEPSVDPRNHIRVVGDDDPDQDQDRPVSVSVDDANSQAAYGLRDLVIKESDVTDTGGLTNAGQGVLERRKFDLWQGRFRIHRWDLQPGDKVLLYLPAIGVNNGGAGVPWVLEEVEERLEQGVARRWGTFVEHVDAAFFRVS